MVLLAAVEHALTPVVHAWGGQGIQDSSTSTNVTEGPHQQQQTCDMIATTTPEEEGAERWGGVR